MPGWYHGGFDRRRETAVWSRVEAEREVVMLPSRVITTNAFISMDEKEVRELFWGLNFAESIGLKRGDMIWAKHKPREGVCGFAQVKVKHLVHGINIAVIEYESFYECGKAVIRATTDGSDELFTLIDEATLMEHVAEKPKLIAVFK